MSFNAFTQKVRGNAGQSVPVWLGVVSPRPVGGVLAEAFRKAGMLIPAGTPVCYDEANGTITPFAAWKVVSVNSSTHAITVEGNAFGVLPAAGDYLGIVGATFATTGAAAAVSTVAAGSTAGQYVITMATSAIDGATAGQYIAWSSATSAGASGKSLANQPNGYLYNDIYFGNLGGSANDYTLAATGAVVMFHHDGLLVELTPSAPFKDAMKAAVPGVLQVLV